MDILAKMSYRISGNFSEDPILALLAGLCSSLKFSIANDTPYFDIMCFMICLSIIAKIKSRSNLILNFLLKTLNFTHAKISTYTVYSLAKALNS